MTTKKRELINALISGLGIKEDVFAIDTVKEKTEFLTDGQCLDFYQAVMNENTFGNGIQAVIKVAESFKPSTPLSEDTIEFEANRLIDLVKGMNNSVYQTHIKTGIRFDDLINDVMFPTLSDEDKAILNNVKPFCELKSLVKGINTYATSLEAIKAFMNAINQKQHIGLESRVSKMIGK